MIDQIIEYINVHPVIFILIILILLFIIYMLYNYHEESFITETSSTNLGGINNTGVTNPALPTPNISISNVINPNTELLGNKNKVVRFRATINGKKYYLMVTPIAGCTNLISQSVPNVQSKQQVSILSTDCLSNVVLLVDEDTVFEGLTSYFNQLSDKEKVCNFQQSLDCNKKISQSAQVIQSSLPIQIGPQTSLPTQESNIIGPTTSENLMPGQETSHLFCPEEFPVCNQIRQYPVDFIIQKSIDSNNNQPNYFIKGISGKLGIDTSAAPYYINQNTRSDVTINTPTSVLCADITDPTTVFNASVDLITSKVENQNNIIGSGSNAQFKTKIRFNIPITPIQMNPYTGKAITKSFYLGACKNNICTVSGINYARACLFNDIFDPNVLEFEPIIINYS